MVLVCSGVPDPNCDNPKHPLPIPARESKNAGAQPVDEPVDGAGRNAKHQHRPGNGEELDTGTGDDSFAAKLNGRGSNGIGKASDGHQRASSGHFRQIVIYAEPCEQNRKYHQTHGSRRSGIRLVQTGSRISVLNQLTQNADQAANPEGVEAIFPNRRFRSHFLDICTVFLGIHVHIPSPFRNSLSGFAWITPPFHRGRREKRLENSKKTRGDLAGLIKVQYSYHSRQNLQSRPGGTNMENVIITIARQHGSGGRLIGECLAKKMGIAYYDKELISLTAKKTGFALDFVKEVEEKQTSSFLYSIYAAATVPSVYEQARNAQFSVIRELAENGPCVIVGRAADCILKNFPNSVHIFIHAPLSERIRRARDDYQEPMDNPERALQKKDKSRAAFYNTYSEYPWGDIRNYDMALNSSIGIDKSADIIWDYVKAKFGM